MESIGSIIIAKYNYWGVIVLLLIGLYAMVAKKNLVKFPLLDGTIPHEITGNYGGGKVFLKPASDGTGIIAGAPLSG